MESKREHEETFEHACHSLSQIEEQSEENQAAEENAAIIGTGCRTLSRADSKTEDFPNWLTLCKLTAGFFCVFFAFSTQQNLMPTVLEESTGTSAIARLSLALLYLVFMPSCIVAPVVLQSVSPRRALPFAAFCYAIYALAGTGPTIAFSHVTEGLASSFLLLAAIFVGIGAAFLWICQGHIITHISPQSLLNRYISFFYTIFNFAAVLGALFADQVMNLFGHSGFFPFLFFVSAFGCMIICSIGPPTQREDIPPEPPLQRPPSQEALCEVLRMPLHILREDCRVPRLVLLGLAVGFSMNAFTSVSLPKIILARSGTSRHVAQALVGLGCGRCAASVGFGLIADAIGCRATLSLSLPFAGLALLLFMLETSPNIGYIHVSFIEIPYAYVGAFCHGLANGTVLCSFSALISSSFPNSDRKTLFALQHFSISCTSTIGFLVIPLLVRWASLTIVYCFFAVSVLSVCTYTTMFEPCAATKEVALPASPIGVVKPGGCAENSL